MPSVNSLYHVSRANSSCTKLCTSGLKNQVEIIGTHFSDLKVALELFAIIPVDSLGLYIFVDTFVTKLTTDTRLLHTTEWHSRVEDLLVIAPDGTSFKSMYDAHAAVRVFRKDTSS